MFLLFWSYWTLNEKHTEFLHIKCKNPKLSLYLSKKNQTIAISVEHLQITLVTITHPRISMPFVEGEKLKQYCLVRAKGGGKRISVADAFLQTSSIVLHNTVPSQRQLGCILRTKTAVLSAWPKQNNYAKDIRVGLGSTLPNQNICSC